MCPNSMPPHTDTPPPYTPTCQCVRCDPKGPLPVKGILCPASSSHQSASKKVAPAPPPPRAASTSTPNPNPNPIPTPAPVSNSAPSISKPAKLPFVNLSDSPWRRSNPYANHRSDAFLQMMGFRQEIEEREKNRTWLCESERETALALAAAHSRQWELAELVEKEKREKELAEAAERKRLRMLQQDEERTQKAAKEWRKSAGMSVVTENQKQENYTVDNCMAAHERAYVDNEYEALFELAKGQRPPVYDHRVEHSAAISSQCVDPTYADNFGSGMASNQNQQQLLKQNEANQRYQYPLALLAEEARAYALGVEKDREHAELAEQQKKRTQLAEEERERLLLAEKDKQRADLAEMQRQNRLRLLAETEKARLRAHQQKQAAENQKAQEISTPAHVLAAQAQKREDTARLFTYAYAERVESEKKVSDKKMRRKEREEREERAESARIKAHEEAKILAKEIEETQKVTWDMVMQELEKREGKEGEDKREVAEKMEEKERGEEEWEVVLDLDREWEVVEKSLL